MMDTDRMVARLRARAEAHSATLDITYHHGTGIWRVLYSPRPEADPLATKGESIFQALLGWHDVCHEDQSLSAAVERTLADTRPTHEDLWDQVAIRREVMADLIGWMAETVARPMAPKVTSLWFAQAVQHISSFGGDPTALVPDSIPVTWRSQAIPALDSPDDDVICEHPSETYPARVIVRGGMNAVRTYRCLTSGWLLIQDCAARRRRKPSLSSRTIRKVQELPEHLQ